MILPNLEFVISSSFTNYQQRKVWQMRGPYAYQLFIALLDPLRPKNIHCKSIIVTNWLKCSDQPKQDLAASAGSEASAE